MNEMEELIEKLRAIATGMLSESQGSYGDGYSDGQIELAHEILATAKKAIADVCLN